MFINVFVFIATCIYTFSGLCYWTTDINFQCNRSHQRAWNNSDCSKTWRAVLQGHSAFTGKNLHHVLCALYICVWPMYVWPICMCLRDNFVESFFSPKCFTGREKKRKTKNPSTFVIDLIALSQRLGTRLLESLTLEQWGRGFYDQL